MQRQRSITRCRRSDGTTRLIVGAALGGILGNSLGFGDSQLASTLLGGPRVACWVAESNVAA